MNLFSITLLLYYKIYMKTKKALAFASAFFGGKGGIRTLERVLAVTRFPVVRLRPAQPPFRSLLLTVNRNLKLLSYYIKQTVVCQYLFEIFFQVFNILLFLPKYVALF